MAERLRDVLSPDIRSRLQINRQGKLTSDQWKDMVTEPLAVLALLLAPFVIVMGPRLVALTARGLIFALLGIVLVLLIPLLFRAWRYARAPLHFERLYAGEAPIPAWQFWRSQVLYTESGVEIRFKKRLTPLIPLRPNRAYLVYYLRDAGQYVLLSIAPADHPDAERWQPSTAFHERFARRAGS
jgi:hypothetical protein